ncbi:hypothetical protein FRC08_018491 [Ceratobasidium sp. 394]|nr:hypothetical protein FRC08_018491 [Ceratobasidium sp. 394]
MVQDVVACSAATPGSLDPDVLSLALKSGRPVKVLHSDTSHCLLTVSFDSEIQIWLGGFTQEHEWALYDTLSRVHNGAVSTHGFSILVSPLSALGQVSDRQQIFKIPTLTSMQVTKANSAPVESFNPKFIVITNRMPYLTLIEGQIQHAIPVFKTRVGSLNLGFIVIADLTGKLYLVPTEGHMRCAVFAGGNCLAEPTRARGFMIGHPNHTATVRIQGAVTGNRVTYVPVDHQAPSLPVKATVAFVSTHWRDKGLMLLVFTMCQLRIDKDRKFSHLWAHDGLELGLVLVPALVFEFFKYTLMITYLIFGYYWLFAHHLPGGGM